MLTQRLAKEVLISTLVSSRSQQRSELDSDTTLAEFLKGLAYLDQLPLTNAEITRELEATHLAWQEFQRGLADQTTPVGLSHIAASSEVLLGHFDHLTDLIERGIHALIGF